jgi:C4-dicarboxylate-specific signal transduction histidine kinase
MHPVPRHPSLLFQVRVVGVPCLSCNNPLLAGRHFDVAVVDEAGQITLPAVLAPLMISSSFVLVRKTHARTRARMHTRMHAHMHALMHARTRGDGRAQ